MKDPFYEKVNEIVKRHGAKGEKLWRLASGFNPLVPPATALDNLKNVVNVIRSDFEDECRSLIKDLDDLFKQTDSTIRSAKLPGIGRLTEISTKLPGGGRITGIFGSRR